MSAKTNYATNKIIDFLFRGQSLTVPSTWYIGLFTSSPSAVGTDGTETSYSGYARVPITGSLANWAGTQGAGSTSVSSGSSRTTSNNADATFPTALSAGGTIVATGIFDASSGGNLWFYGALPTPQPIYAGNIPYFPAGTFAYQEDA